MPMLQLICATTERSLPIGIDVSRDEKLRMPNELKFIRCPYCNRDHGWKPDDVFFEEQ